MKHLLILTILWSLSLSVVQANEVPFGVFDTIGSGCVTFEDQNIKKGQQVKLVSFNPNKIFKGVVTNKKNELCKGYISGTSYNISFPLGSPITIIGIAVIASDATFSTKNKVLLTTKDKKTITLSECLGMEGVNYWAKQDSKEVWHAYYYLGYDVDSTCK